MMPDTAKELVRLGANLVIEESTFMPDTLRELATLARGSGASVTIRRQVLLPDLMKELARIGGNRITFTT